MYNHIDHMHTQTHELHIHIHTADIFVYAHMVSKSHPDVGQVALTLSPHWFRMVSDGSGTEDPDAKQFRQCDHERGRQLGTADFGEFTKLC